MNHEFLNGDALLASEETRYDSQGRPTLYKRDGKQIASWTYNGNEIKEYRAENGSLPSTPSTTISLNALGLPDTISHYGDSPEDETIEYTGQGHKNSHALGTAPATQFEPTVKKSPEGVSPLILDLS